jgi:hypothetical protein
MLHPYVAESNQRRGQLPGAIQESLDQVRARDRNR